MKNLAEIVPASSSTMISGGNSATHVSLAIAYLNSINSVKIFTDQLRLIKSGMRLLDNTFRENKKRRHCSSKVRCRYKQQKGRYVA